jgi:hypothetical protein
MGSSSFGWVLDIRFCYVGNSSYLWDYHLIRFFIFIYMNKKIRLVLGWIWASCEALGEYLRLGGRPF